MDKKSICGRLYDRHGLEIEPEFVINEESAVCRYPVVAADGNGHFTVARLETRDSHLLIY